MQAKSHVKASYNQNILQFKEIPLKLPWVTTKGLSYYVYTYTASLIILLILSFI